MVGHHFHHIRVGDLGRIFDPLLQRAHDDFGIVNQRQNRGIDGIGIDQRFVALNVDDDFRGFGGGDLGDAVRAGQVVGAGHADAGAEISCNFVHSLVVCGNYRACQITRLGGTFVHVLQHGF